MKIIKTFFSLFFVTLIFFIGATYVSAGVPQGNIGASGCQAGSYENSCDAHVNWTTYYTDAGTVKVVATYADGHTSVFSTSTSGYDSYTFTLPKYGTDKDVNIKSFSLYYNEQLLGSTSAAFSYSSSCASGLIYRDVVENAATFKHMMTCAAPDPVAPPAPLPDLIGTMYGGSNYTNMVPILSGSSRTFTFVITNKKGVNYSGPLFNNLIQTATGLDASGNPIGLNSSTVMMKGSYVGFTGTRGAEEWEYISIPFNSVNTKYIRGCADSSNTISESDETNNCSSWADVTVTTNSFVDLRSDINTSSFAVGKPSVVTGTIHDYGSKSGSSIPSSTVLFQTATGEYRTRDYSDPYKVNSTSIKDYPVTSKAFMSADSAGVESFSVNSPSLTLFAEEGLSSYIRVCADKSSKDDINGVIVESDETNNCSPWSEVIVSTAPPITDFPDLKSDIDNLSYVYPNNFVVNTNIVFSGPVGNGGNASTNYLGVNTFTNKFQTATNISDINNPVGVVDYPVSGMTNLEGSNDITNPWKSTSTYSRFSKTIKFTSVGTYYIRTCADSLNNIAEAHENDNCSSWMTVNVLASGAPDLQASAVTPTTSTAGTDQTFSARITNVGNMSTGYLGVLSFGNLFQTASGFDLTNGVTDYSKPFDLTNYAPTWTSNLHVLKSAGSFYTINGNTTYEDQSQISMSIKFPEARNYYYVRACADKSSSVDTNGVIVESNEANNCGEWTAITVTPASTVCSDSSAQNYNLKLPCFYDATFCKVESDPNYAKAPCATVVPVDPSTDPCGGNGANNPPLCNMKCS